MERELEIIKNMPGVEAASFFTMKVINLHMNYVIGTDTKVKILVDGKHSGVEATVADILNKANYKVLRGDNVHIASFILARKYMTYVDLFDCFSEAEKATAKRLISQSNSLLKDFLIGKHEKLLPLLKNMQARWELRPSGSLTDTGDFITAFMHFLSLETV